jgi:hypothetical protein
MPRIAIEYQPQEYQQKIHDNSARYKVVVIGRRGGKTEFLLQEQIKNAYSNSGLHWIIAPSYRQVKSICWRRLKAILSVDTDWKYNEQELSAEHLKIGTRLELKGADNEDSLKGMGLKSAGLDECAIMKSNVWPEIIRPMLADFRGPATFISTPKAKNWFYDLYMKGLNEDKDWQSWRYPTSVNQYIIADEIEQMKKDMSERLFRQEVLAEFLEDEAGVFQRIRSCIVGSLQNPIVGRFYVMGVDLAKTQDFTVLVVIDTSTREVVAFERFSDISWTEQKLRIQKLAHKYNNALTVIDASGVGDPIVEDLQNANISLYYEGDKPGFKFTNESKSRLIDQLALAIEQRLITFPNIEVLIEELRQFSYSISQGGRIIYSAPEGKYDDCVIGLALANWGIRTYLHSAQTLRDYDKEIQDKQGRGELVGVDQYKIDRPWRNQ